MFTERAVVKSWLTILAVAALATMGCQDPSTGPTTDEFQAARAEQAERAAKAKPKAAKPKAAPAAAAASGAGGGFGAVDVAFAYDDRSLRDPFRNFKWERPDRVVDTSALGPLEQYDLSQLSLVAVVWKTGNARALIQDPSGESYIIAEGARLGKNSGTVLDIEDNIVRVKETYVDFLGRETTKDIELRMPGNEGG
jgi:hypothetical protein